MTATYIGDLYLALLQHLINCKQDITQNDSLKLIYWESVFMGMLGGRYKIEWHILRPFRM